MTTDKRVVLINVTMGQGSTGRIVAGIYDELTAHGCSCMAVYGRGKAPEGYNAYRVGSDMDVNVHGVLSRITDRQGYYSVRATNRLIDHLKRFKPDIVHMHNIHGYFLNFPILFKYLKDEGIQVIWTLHDCWSFTGHCTHFEYAGCDKWLTGCHSCSQLKEYPRSMLADASKKNYAEKRALFTQMDGMQLVTPSKWLRQLVLKSYMGKYPVQVVPTGIDLSVFKPTESDIRKAYGLDNKFVILGAAAPWRERKGLFEFVKLAQLLPADYKIVLVGITKKQAEVLPDSVLALERTESVKEMAMWYSLADAYVNLTLEDTFPTTNIEAQACGTPVVTYRVGGSPESLTTDSGIVVEQGDIAGVVRALESIKNGESRAAYCIERAAEYSSEKRFKQYFEEVYAPILQ